MEKSTRNAPEKGLIFNIQRFSIHDGPGIRTTVFMKGCPLKCLWCSNPESQDFIPNLMVREINCRGCGACVAVCPDGVITLNKDGVREIDWTRCNHCLRCSRVCLYHSLNVCGQYMDVQEVLDEVIRDEAFYRNSGGGITLSGGEPLSQAEFVMDLLRESKAGGLHTALDTSGFAPWEKIEGVLPFVDLFLWDIKHLDPEEHRRTTGVSNEFILENLIKAVKLTEVWLRIPLISGLNDSAGHIRQIAIMAREIGAPKISLLPYHEGGKSKSEQLGRPYPFPEGKPPAPEYIDHLRQIIEAEGLKASVGN